MPRKYITRLRVDDVIVNLFLSINSEIIYHNFNEKDFDEERINHNYHIPIVKEYYANLFYK
jgi:hypothetical protein